MKVKVRRRKTAQEAWIEFKKHYMPKERPDARRIRVAIKKKPKMVQMYLGNCDELDCEHWSWCGDSYGDKNTECFCRFNGARVYRCDAEEKHILCPLGKMMEDENDG